MCPRLARLGKYLAPGAYPGLLGERAEEAVTIAAGVVDPMLKARDSLITTKLERLKSETELLKAEKEPEAAKKGLAAPTEAQQELATLQADTALLNVQLANLQAHEALQNAQQAAASP